MSTLVLLVELTLNVGQKGAFLTRAREHRKNVLSKEPGCKGFELLVPTDGSETVFLYESYVDQAAIDRAAKALYTDAKPSTLNRQVYTPVCAILHFAAERGLCEWRKIRRPKQPTGRVRWLRPEEAESPIKACAPT